MSTLTFRVGNHIFILKNHITWFCDFWPKIFGNILKFSSFSVQKIFYLFFWNHKLNYWEWHLLFYSNTSSFWLFALVYTLNHNFCNETTVRQKSIKALFYRELKKFITPKLAKSISRPIHRVKFNKLNSWKKNISFDVIKFRFFRLFSKI